MWVLSKDGFISVVRYDPKNDRNVNSPFPGIAYESKNPNGFMLVRARVPEHLEPLKKEVPGLVIVDDRGADYRFRAIVPDRMLKRFLVREVDEIDYKSHFKEALRAAQPSHLKAGMYSAAMSTWTNFAKLQHTVPYSGIQGGRKGKRKGNQRTSKTSWWGPGSSSGSSYQSPTTKPAGGTAAGTPTKGADGKTASEAIADYQRSQGVKPFPTQAQQDVLDEQFVYGMDDWNGILGDNQDEPATGPTVDLDTLVELLLDRKGDLHMQEGELAELDDEAFEAINILHERYGLVAKVGKSLIEKVADEVRAMQPEPETNEPEHKPATVTRTGYVTRWSRVSDDGSISLDDGALDFEVYHLDLPMDRTSLNVGEKVEIDFDKDGIFLALRVLPSGVIVPVDDPVTGEHLGDVLVPNVDPDPDGKGIVNNEKTEGK